MTRLSSSRNALGVLLALLLAVAAIGVSACGDDDEETTTTTAPTGATGVEDDTGGEDTGGEDTGGGGGGAADTGGGGAADTGDVREQFDAALRENLIQTQGLTAAQADCAIKRLQETVSDEQIEQVLAGEQPKAVQEAAFEAGTQCANAG